MNVEVKPNSNLLL